MFFIYMYDDNTFSFESKWSPSNDSLQFLAKKHKVTITNQYSELGCMVLDNGQVMEKLKKMYGLQMKSWI